MYTGRLALYYPEDGIADILNAVCKCFGMSERYYFDGQFIVRIGPLNRGIWFEIAPEV